MTFPSALKKSGPVTISKTRSGSTTSPGSPRSPGSSPKLVSSRSSVKVSSTVMDSEITNVKTSVTSVKKLSAPPKVSLASKPITKVVIDAKPVPIKTAATSTTNEVKKSKTKPPPLVLNIKSTDVNQLLSPATPKFAPKTPITLSSKSLTSAKSPMVSKLASVSKSPLVSTKVVKSSSSRAPTISSSVIKSPQVLSETKSQTVPLLIAKSSTSKSSIVSSPVNKSPHVSVSLKSSMSSSAIKSPLTSAVSKTSTMITTTPKSTQLPSQPSTTTVKPVVKVGPASLKSITTKDRGTIVMKPTTPIKKAPVISINSITGVKLPTTPTKKLSINSLSTTSSVKSNSLKTPTSPSKLLTKELNTTNIISSIKTTVTNKSGVISKLGPTSPKVLVKKESSALSLLSVKSSSTIKSTSVVSKPITLKSKIAPLTTSKNIIPKSPIVKTQPLAVTKTTPFSPTMKTSLSPSSKTRSLPLSPAKPPLSPAIKKLVPTKLILSPGMSKSKSISSSRLSSVSTESLVSRTSLKSPSSPKPNKVVPRSPTKVIKKTEEHKKLQGGQSGNKTIAIPGITELYSNLAVNEEITQNVECWLENSVKSVLLEEIKSTTAQMPDQDLSNSKKLETHKMVVNINDVNQLTDVPKNTLESIKEDSIELSLTSFQEKTQEDDLSYLDFVIVKKDECEPPYLNSISQNVNNCDIVFNDNYFDKTTDNVIVDQLPKVDEIQSCTYTDEHFEPMNDKLVLGDVPFETDSSDISDNEQSVPKEIIETENCEVTPQNCVGDVFLFSKDILSSSKPMNDKLVLGDAPFETDSSNICDNEQSVPKEITENGNCEVTPQNCEDDVFSFSKDILSSVDLNRTDSTENFIHQFMPKSICRSEGSSSISTDDESLLSRKSYSEALVGTPKDGENYFEYDIEMIDDSLDYDYEEGSVFVEVTEKEFPELKPKDLSGNRRRRNKKQKKRNNNRTESQYDSNTCPEVNYNPEEFNGSEFSQYIKMMKDCSFYPNSLFSSDPVRISSSSLSWLDITVRTTDDDLASSTESLSTFEVFRASNLNKDFLTSIIGSTTASPTNETWFWKSIEGGYHTHNKANITLCLQPRPKHLTTPRFMILLALISEAKGYQIQPSLSKYFITDDCMPRFNDKIRRLMVQGLWFIGRLINDSLSEDVEMNYENPFEFVDGDIGFWWAGIYMLDWQEFLKTCGKNDRLTCFQFVIQNNADGNGYNCKEGKLIMNAMESDEFLSELDIENFIHTIRNVKYYSDNCFVDSEDNIVNVTTNCDNDGLTEWENGSIEQH